MLEHVLAKFDVMSGGLLPPLKENTKKKGRPKKMQARDKSGHEHENERLAQLREAKERGEEDEEREKRRTCKKRTIDVDADVSGDVALLKRFLPARE